MQENTELERQLLENLQIEKLEITDQIELEKKEKEELHKKTIIKNVF